MQHFPHYLPNSTRELPEDIPQRLIEEVEQEEMEWNENLDNEIHVMDFEMFMEEL